MNGNDVKSLIWLILALGVVFYLTWLTTRFVAGRARGNQSGHHMKVLDRLALAGDKSLVVVRVAGRCSLLSVCGHEVRLLRHLNDEEAALYTHATQPTGQAAGLPGVGSLWQALRRQAGASFGLGGRTADAGQGWRDAGWANGETPRSAEQPQEDATPGDDTPGQSWGESTTQPTDEEMLELLDRRVRERRQAGRR